MKKFSFFFATMLCAISCARDPEKEKFSRPEPPTVYKETMDFEDLVPVITNISEDSIRKIMAKSKEPVILYFSGYACVNCRRMEHEIVQNEQLLELVSKLPLIILKVDDKTPLSPKERSVSSFNGDSVTNVGQRAMELEYRFNKNYQPKLVKLDDDFEVLDSLDYSTFDRHAKAFFGTSSK